MMLPIGVDGRVEATTERGERLDLVGRGGELVLDLSSAAALKAVSQAGGSPLARLRRLAAVADVLDACGLVGHVDVGGCRVASVGRSVDASWLARLFGARCVDIHLGAWMRAVFSRR